MKLVPAPLPPWSKRERSEEMKEERGEGERRGGEER